MTTSAIRPKVERTGWEMFGIFCAGCATVAFGAIAYGFTFLTLWGWFVVPTFVAPPLSLAVAVGLDLTVGAVLPFPTNNPDDDGLDASALLGKAVTRTLAKSLLLLSVGFIAHLFV